MLGMIKLIFFNLTCKKKNGRVEKDIDYLTWI